MLFIQRYLLFALLCFSSLATPAQTVTGTITGTIVDPSTQVIAGAKVTLTNDRTGDARNTTTNESGNFLFPAVSPGTYSVKIEQTGFRSLQRQGFVLSANDRLSLGDLQLTVGQIGETVTVTAEGSLVQTASSEHSAQITSKQLELISQRGRDVTSLLKILPGVSFGGESESAGGGFGSGIPNIQGGRNTWNTLNVDGMRGNDLGSPNVFSSTINFDAISEVKVLLNSYQAEYAGNASANVNIVTKSGSSQYHGSGYWYKRHEQFNAQNFFNNVNKVAKPRYRYTTLGATIGGPVWLPKEILKDKLFFFYSFEDNKTLNPQALRQVTVPTDLERSGDFSQTRDTNNALIVVRDPVTGLAFPDNKIPTARINKNGQALLNVFPKANALDRALTGGNFNYLFQESIDVPKRQNLFRTDFKPNSKDSFYVRGSMWWADNKGIAVPAGTANWGLAGLHYTFTDDGITGNWARVISPTLVNEASIGVRHSVEDGPPLNDTELAKLQRKTYNFTLGQFNPGQNPLSIIPQASFGGVPNAAAISYDGRLPLRGADTLITFNDNLTYTKGSHTMKTGIYFERVRNYEGATSTFAGNFAFARDVNNPLDANYAYANALLGNFQNYQESTARPSGEGRQALFDFFVQDSWKATRRLTVEMGARFSWYNHWYQSNGKAAAFSLERFDPAKAPRYYQPGCAVALPANGVCPAASRRARNPITNALSPAVLIGGFVPGSGDPYNGMVLATDNSYPRGFRAQEPIQFQPRLGFSWDIFGTGKTALRGSGGVFSQTRVSANAVWNDVSRNPPVSETPRIFYGNMDTLLSSSGALFPSNVAGFQNNGHTPVTYNYSLGIQHDIGFGTILDVSYVGSQSRHLQQQRNLNVIPYGARFATANQNPVVAGSPLADDFLRPYQGYGNITYFEYAGNSNYNALQVAANRRFIKGFQFGLAYTYSRTMDTVDGDRDGLALYRPSRIWHYGPAGFDQTHVMVINYTWELPRASKLMDNVFIKTLFDNWQISGITAYVSGTPGGIGFSTVDNADITGGGDGARVNVVGSPNLPSSKQVINPNTKFVQWIDPTVFRRPARGDFGNAAKYVFRNPGTHNYDLSLFKNFPLKSEGRYLQFRWEVYNLPNHTQWSGIDTTARFDAAGNQVNTRFGQVTGARAPRVMQGSLRFTF